jgi:hypothetical protein
MIQCLEETKHTNGSAKHLQTLFESSHFCASSDEDDVSPEWTLDVLFARSNACAYYLMKWCVK